MLLRPAMNYCFHPRFEVMTAGGEKQIIQSPIRSVQHGMNQYYMQHGHPQPVQMGEYEYYATQQQQQVQQHAVSPNHPHIQHQQHAHGGYAPQYGAPQQVMHANYGMPQMMAYDPAPQMATSPMSSPMKSSAPIYSPGASYNPATQVPTSPMKTSAPIYSPGAPYNPGASIPAIPKSPTNAIPILNAETEEKN